MLTGFIYVCHDFDHCFNEGLRFLRTINPLAKIALIIEKTDQDSIEEILRRAWIEFKMLNIMIINVSGEIGVIYNPFINRIKLFNLHEEIDFEEFAKERMSNLYGYPLRINVFDVMMLCRVIEKKKYELACSEILYTIKRLMNMTLEYVEPNDGEEFGYIHSNGTYMGSLGEVEYERVDISVVLRSIAEYKEALNLYFLTPVIIVKFCFVVPNNFYPLTFEVFPHKFVDNITLVLVIFSMFMLILVTYVIDTLTKSRTSIIKIALSYFSLYNNVSIVSTPTKLYSRLLCGTMLIFTIIMSNSYQGSIIRQLNTMGSAANIETIEQLLASDLIIRVPSGPDKYIRDFQSFPKESRQKRLIDKQIVTETSSAIQIKYAAYDRKAAIMCPNFFIEIYETIFLSNVTGESLINYVPECVFEYYMSVMVPKSSPFINHFNRIIQLVIEAGLIEYQYDRGKAESKLAYTRQVKEGIFFEKTERLLSMKELQTLFTYYCIWLGIAFIVLIIEIIVSKVKFLSEKFVFFCE